MIDMIRVGQTRNLLRASSSPLEIWPRSAHHHPGQRRHVSRTNRPDKRTHSITCPATYNPTTDPGFCAGQSGNTFEYKQFGGEGLAFFILAWLFELVNVIFLCRVVPRASGGDGGGSYADFDKQKPQAGDVAGYGSQESGGYNAPGSGASGWGGQPTTVAQY